MKLNIANHASYCIKVLEDAGFEAYCVGGAVRDLLLGLTPSDYDIATNAYPEDIIPLFDKKSRKKVLKFCVFTKFVKINTFFLSEQNSR